LVAECSIGKENRCVHCGYVGRLTPQLGGHLLRRTTAQTN
jgi:hypothetical protein